MIFVEGDFEGSIIPQLHHMLMDEAPAIDTGHWQALKNVPHTATRELFRVCMEVGIPVGSTMAQAMIQPNLPWAEDHFQERVAGMPTNPGDQYFNWPWYSPNWKAQRKEAGLPNIFSHTYQERMWPRFARSSFSDIPLDRRTDRMGIRFRYGDLNDLINLLAREPTTRQAYLPIWFPEDTGAHHGERVPCTLGYHFILRYGMLHCTYHIRSCDFLRYFRDDVYMAMRLTQWILGELQDLTHIGGVTFNWNDAIPGILQMNITSLHIFEGDMSKMRREAPPKP